MFSSRITRLIPVIQDFMAKNPIKRAWLFGSCSRGEETASSDIDILVDFDNSDGTVSLFKMGGMLTELTRILGRKVDLVDNDGLMDFARDSVDRDKILIYERHT